MKVIEEKSEQSGWWCSDCESFSTERVCEELEKISISWDGPLQELYDYITNGNADTWTAWNCSDCGECGEDVCIEVIAGETDVFVCGECDAVYVDRERAEECCR